MLIPILIGILIFVLLLVFWSLQKNPDRNIVGSFWDKFQSMFIENSETGIWSSNRFAYVFTMFISNLVIWGGILYVIITTITFPEIPNGVIMVYGISNGVASFAKVWQKREERFIEQIESTERINTQTNGEMPHDNEKQK